MAHMRPITPASFSLSTSLYALGGCTNRLAAYGVSLADIPGRLAEHLRPESFVGTVATILRERKAKQTVFPRVCPRGLPLYACGLGLHHGGNSQEVAATQRLHELPCSREYLADSTSTSFLCQAHLAKDLRPKSSVNAVASLYCDWAATHCPCSRRVVVSRLLVCPFSGPGISGRIRAARTSLDSRPLDASTSRQRQTREHDGSGRLL